MAKRINKGIYELTTHNGKFEVERFPDGAWMLFRIHALPCAEPREYVDDFDTKAEAIRYAGASAPFETGPKAPPYDGPISI